MSQAPAAPQWSQVCLQFMNKLQELQQSGYLCDLTFELKNQKFRAHKVVMSAWSPLIHKLLGDGSGTLETIRVHYDNTEVFGSFLAFLYSCRMDDIAEQSLIQILHLATSLQVNPVRQVCEEEFKTQLKISNIISSFHLARKYRLPNLEEYAMAYMQMNLPEAVKQADFLSLSPPRFNSFLSSGWVCVMKPEVKLFLIISWLGYHVKERQQYLVLLLKYIDWSTVANDFLNEISQTENFFTTNESSLYLLLQTLFSSLIPLGPYMDSFPALREKYAYLLDHIVQNSFVFPLEVEDFCPVSFHLLPPPPHRTSAFNGNGTGVEAGQRNQLAEAVSSGDHVSLEYSDNMQDLSNDSVTAGIGLRMRNVAIEEFQASCSDKVMLSGHAVTSHCDDRDNHTGTEGDGSGVDFKVHLSPGSPESQSLFNTAPPSKVLDIAGRKRKGPADLKHRVSAEVKAERAAQGKVSESNKSGKTTSEGSAAKSSTDRTKMTGSETSDTVTLRTEGETTGDTTITQLSRRPKRRAAANFSVPEKLIPRLRKTKALLKEVTIVPAAKSQELREASEGDSEQENGVSDSDVEEDDSRDLQEDTKRDPDFNLPRKRSRSSKVSKAAQKQQKLSAKSSDNVTVSDTVTDSFSLSLKSKMSDDVTQGAASGSDQSQISEQEVDDGKAEENKSGKKACQWKRQCDQCDYSAPTQRRLDNHIERVHGSRATVYACTMCSFECMWSKSFFEHMKHHFQGPPYVCDVEGCRWETERIQVLLIHRRRHVDERPYKCPQCSSKFRTRNNLIAHFKCHADNKNHECPVCHRRFKMKNTMQQHLVTHSDARPYLCDTCGFSTKFQSHLISHKRIHTGEVFMCNFINCNYSSPKRSQLKAHMRSHLNIRHHTCEVCQKAFVEKSHLVRHLKIHQDERPHKCDQCEYSSTRIDKVNEHKRKYHSEEAVQSKRQYKYAPRGKNRIVKTSSKMDKKPSTLPSSLTMPHAPILIPGRPIRPKKPKEIRLTAIPIKPSIEALVSAAEELGLADMVEQSGADQLNGDGREGKGRRGVKPESSSGSIQLALGYNGEVLVKDEQLEEPRLVMDLHDTDTDPLGTSVPVRNGKRNSGLDSKKNGSADRGSKRTGRNTNKSQIQIQISRSSNNSMVHQTGYTPLPSHTSAALLQQLAASALRQPPPPPPPSGLNLGAGAVLLPHTATPDVQAASHILLSARQQHSAAAFSAADSLASLSSGFGLPRAVPETPASAAVVSQGAQFLQQQHGVVNGQAQQQPLSAQPQSQAVHPLPDDCGGLTAFFHVLN